jgi:hypothetical protein
MSGNSGVKANRPTPIATAREIIPTAQIAIGDGDARSVNASRIENPLNSPTYYCGKEYFLTNDLL